MLEVINNMLERGEVCYGSDFATHLNEAVLPVRGTPYHKTRTVVLRPSEDLGGMAARCAERTRLRAPVRQLIKLGLRLAAPIDRRAEGEVLSYLLFDTSYVNELIELGYSDAASHEDALASFFLEQETAPRPVVIEANLGD
jgi:NTE family protein